MPHAPRMNVYAGRFTRATRKNVTGQMLILGENHLRQVMTEEEERYATGRAQLTTRT